MQRQVHQRFDRDTEVDKDIPATTHIDQCEKEYMGKRKILWSLNDATMVSSMLINECLTAAKTTGAENRVAEPTAAGKREPEAL